MGVSENSVPHFPNGFADHYPYYNWAISLGRLTQHFQTNPYVIYLLQYVSNSHGVMGLEASRLIFGDYMASRLGPWLAVGALSPRKVPWH